MDKQTLLNEFYRAKIAALIEHTKDAVLLDLIYKLLLKESENK